MKNRVAKLLIGIAVLIILGLIIFIVSAEIAAAPEKSINERALSITTGNQTPAGNLPEPPPITTLIFGGDVMLSRVVGQKMAKDGDWTWPFKDIASVLSAADLAIINLESPFTFGGSHLVKTGSFSFNADPEAVAGLKSAGIDVASLANNHILNQGAKGIDDTRKILADNGMAAVGAGLNADEAYQPTIKEINDLKFGFLGFAYPDDNSVAGASTPGLANLNIAAMADAVADLKAEVDVIIILMHAGVEYVSRPNNQQTAFARAAIDAGADLVIGHHPHWTQTTEIYREKPILYSLGNLVFDQMWSTETQEGALARAVWVDKKLKKIEIIPIIIRDYGRAEIAGGAAKRRVLDRMELKDGMIEL